MTLMTPKKYFWFVAIGVIFAACGTSLYRPLAKTDSDVAKKESAMMALDNSDYETAEPILSELWAKNKTDELTQLYAVSIMGTVGLDLFSVITTALTKCQSGDASSSCSGDSLLNNINASVPAGLDRTKVTAKLKSTVDVLNQAPTKASAIPLLCFSGGLYINYVMTDLQTQFTTIQENLKADLASLGAACVDPSGAGVDAVGKKVEASVNALGAIGTAIKDVTKSVGSCISAVSGGTGTTNDIQKTLAKFESNADKGCTLPESGVLGQLPLPACIATFVKAGAQADAGDGRIDGCELFLNCMNGECI